MREIKFRGKSVGGDWLHGFFINYNTDREILRHALHNGSIYYEHYPCQILQIDENGEKYFEVDCKTIGLFTGKKDKNSREIYEGDIVKTKAGRAIVRFGEIEIPDNEGYGENKLIGFYLEWIDNSGWYGLYTHIDKYLDNCEVIGNIYDNPELGVKE